MLEKFRCSSRLKRPETSSSSRLKLTQLILLGVLALSVTVSCSWYVFASRLSEHASKQWTILPRSKTTAATLLSIQSAQELFMAESCASSQLVALLGKLPEEYRNTLFLADPELLINFAPPKDVKHLISHDLLPRLRMCPGEARSIISFGLVAKSSPSAFERRHPASASSSSTAMPSVDVDNIDAFVELMKSQGYTAHVHRLDNFDGFWDIPSHIFLSQEGRVLYHVAVFHSRAKHYLVAPVPSIPERSLFPSGKPVLGDTAQIFDALALQTLLYDNIYKVAVPQAVGYFLMQLSTSSYYPCDYAGALEYRRTHPVNETIAWKKFSRENFITGLDAMVAVQSHFLIPVILSAGTLLGWRRECDFIPYTDDSDYASFLRFAREDLITEIKSNAIPNLRVKERYGYTFSGYELVMRAGAKVDWFFLEELENENIETTHFHGEKAYVEISLPKFHICASEFIGRKVLVPCDANGVIVAAYTKDWRKPHFSSGIFISRTKRGMVKWNATLAEDFHEVI